LPAVELPNNWQPRRYQFPLWNALQNEGKKRAIEIAHRRWGKDDVILHHTAIEAHKRVATYWHCLPEYEQARKAIWNAVNPHTGMRRIDEAFPEALRASKDEQQMFIRFKNGSTWQVVGSDRYNSLVGAGVAGVVFSEWALCNPSSWGYIRPMMEENDGWACFITTPRGRNHAKAMYDMARDNPRWFAELSSIHETGALTAQQLEDSLAEYIAIYGDEMGRAQFEQEYECSFNAAILGAFYAREMAAVRREGRIDANLEPLPGRPVHRAWDIGVKDDTSIWWFQVVGTQIFILDCYSASGVGLDHYASVLEERRKEHGWLDGIDFVPHDAKVKEWGSGKTRVETMREYGLKPQLCVSATKMDGINAARQALARCVFHQRCEDEGISALEQYRREWDDDKKAFKASEVHDWSSHLADAFRYLALSWRTAPIVDEAPRLLMPPPGRFLPPEAMPKAKIDRIKV
jgi:phage terminase large subunit